MTTFKNYDIYCAEAERAFVEGKPEFMEWVERQECSMLAEEELDIILQRDFDEMVHDYINAIEYVREEEFHMTAKWNDNLGEFNMNARYDDSPVSQPDDSLDDSNESIYYRINPNLHDILARSLSEIKLHVIAGLTMTKNDIMKSLNQMNNSMNLMIELQKQGNQESQACCSSGPTSQNHKEKNNTSAKYLIACKRKLFKGSHSEENMEKGKGDDNAVNEVKKQRIVYRVIANEGKSAILVNSLGCYTLEYNIKNENQIAIFLPQISDWFQKYISHIGDCNERKHMPDCMCQILAVLAIVNTNASRLEVVPFLISIEKQMTRQQVCQIMQEYSFEIAGVSNHSHKNIGLAMFQVDGSFCCALFHTGTRIHGAYHSTFVIMAEKFEMLEHINVEGIADYFKILFGMCDESFTWKKKYVKFHDATLETQVFHPFTFESFRKTNIPCEKTSHIIMMKFVITFVSFFDSSNLFSNFITTNEVHPEFYNTIQPSTILKMDMYSLCYRIVAIAIERGLFKVARLPCGEEYVGDASAITSAFQHDVKKAIEKIVGGRRFRTTQFGMNERDAKYI